MTTIEQLNAKTQEFENIVRPLIKWLNENHHPHTTIIVEPNGARLVEGIIGIPCTDYIKD